MDTYKDMAEEFCELEGLGHSPGDSWKMMELSRLDPSSIRSIALSGR